ncbi:hypothetical protein BU14_0647s0007 [Porphyra umbilicalis]|uniref:Acireductone dioxygenase n=1 Tax=Porphyra umbilicalis TaxID=2786 RepID=A0A1X6NQL3_PORUM|nr:hypothetical protein BU14_0647s0007 [Porphyra umbilicalis]|eukprot:OSX70867.1 hypothetical protein BU14_0647s0007 [Porphyra umbilicalis]
MKAWLMDGDGAESPRAPHHRTPDTPVSLEELKHLGVLYWYLDPKEYSADDTDAPAKKQMQAIRAERRYAHADEVVCSAAGMGDAFPAKCASFFEEHLHEDEEIRYILDGSGYFDIRSPTDAWVRIAVTPGDMIVLPAGAYHRFTVDEAASVRAVRLFRDAPAWTPIARGAGLGEGDDLSCRKSYLASLAGGEGATAAS